MVHLPRTSILCLLALCCNNQLQAQECVDTPPYYNGWGWNGSESCRTNHANQVLNQCSIVPVDNVKACLDNQTGLDKLPELVDCEDPDGDGWGWNDLQGSCIANTNLVRNGAFNNGSNGWNTYLHPDSIAVRQHLAEYEDSTPFASTFWFPESYAEFSYHRAGTQWWHSQLYTDPISLEGGRTYQLSFYASSSSRTGAATGSVVVENGTDYTKYLDRQDFAIYIGGDYNYAEFYVPASDNNARVTFNLGNNFGGRNSGNIGAIAIDDVRLVAKKDDPDRQDNSGSCDYTLAPIHGGWGWNPVTSESCAPKN